MEPFGESSLIMLTSTTICGHVLLPLQKFSGLIQMIVALLQQFKRVSMNSVVNCVNLELMLVPSLPMHRAPLSMTENDDILSDLYKAVRAHLFDGQQSFMSLSLG